MSLYVVTATLTREAKIRRALDWKQKSGNPELTSSQALERASLMTWVSSNKRKANRVASQARKAPNKFSSVSIQTL